MNRLATTAGAQAMMDEEAAGRNDGEQTAPIESDSDGAAGSPPLELQPTAERARRYAAEREIGVALLERIGGGDEEALADFYKRFSATLYGVALRMMKHEKEAEDVLQNAFIYIWRKAASFDPELSSPFAWAVLIVRNRAIDRLRTWNRAGRIFERMAEEVSRLELADEDSAEQPFLREQREMVRAALARLAEEQREALELAFFSGLTHEQIAEQVGAPLGTIKARIRRGLIRMRDLVKNAR